MSDLSPECKADVRRRLRILWVHALASPYRFYTGQYSCHFVVCIQRVPELLPPLARQARQSVDRINRRGCAYKTVRPDFVRVGQTGRPICLCRAATREDSPVVNALQDAVPVALPRAAFGCACGRSDSDLRRFRHMIRSASYPEPDVSPSTNGSRISWSANPTIASTRSRRLH
jgi:hypothetical protein